MRYANPKEGGNIRAIAADMRKEKEVKRQLKKGYTYSNPLYLWEPICFGLLELEHLFYHDSPSALSNLPPDQFPA
jgi:hypothetical protein